MFFMQCLNKGYLNDKEMERYHRLIPRVKEEQCAFHFEQQYRFIKDPAYLDIYLSCKPNVLNAVDAWLQQNKSRVYSLPQYYEMVGSVKMPKETPPLTWISEITSLEKLPMFDRCGFQTLWQKGEEDCLASETDVFDPYTLPQKCTGHRAHVEITEEALLCFLQLSSDAVDTSFEIPVEIETEGDHKRYIFGDPLPKPELDLRQKQDMFFSQALTRRYGTRSRTALPCAWCMSEWKLGPTSILIKRREQLTCSSPISTRPVPVKIFTKIEYINEIYPHAANKAFEVFTSEELAKHWLALLLRRNGEVHVRVSLESNDGDDVCFLLCRLHISHQKVAKG